MNTKILSLIEENTRGYGKVEELCSRFADVAEEMNIERPDEINVRQNLGKWKKGAIPSGENLIILARLFDVDLAYLIGESEERKQSVADVMRETGLSEAAVRVLREKKKKADKQGHIYLNSMEQPTHAERYLEIVSDLITTEEFRQAVLNIYTAREAQEQVDQNRRMYPDGVPYCSDYKYGEYEQMRVERDEINLSASEYKAGQKFAQAVEKVIKKNR